MTKKKSSSQAGRAALFVALFLVLGALAVFKSGVVELPKLKSSSPPPALVETIRITGLIKPDALHLSRKEIKCINRTVLKHRHTFPSINVTLDPGNPHKVYPIEKDTPLTMVMVLKTDDSNEVTSWPTKLARKELVPQMVRFMDKAADEFAHYKKLRKGKRIIKKLYI